METTTTSTTTTTTTTTTTPTTTPSKDYHIFSGEETNLIRQNFSPDVSLSDVKMKMNQLKGSISPKVTPEKIHSKIKRDRKSNSTCRRKLKLPELFQPIRPGNLSDEE